MTKVMKSLPSVKYMAITIAICLVLGVLMAGGFHLKALGGLAIAVVFLMMVTLRNYDPMSWEAYNEPHAHRMRHQRDDAVKQLRAVVAAFDNDDRTALVYEMTGARKLLSESYSSTQEL